MKRIFLALFLAALSMPALYAQGARGTGGTVTVDTTGIATSTKQSDGSQKSQICDAGGDCTTVTGSKLDVNASVDTTGLATSTKQSDGSQKSQIVDGSGNVIGATSNALDVNIKSGAATGYTQDAALTVATTVGTIALGRASAAVPTDVSADNDAVIPWYLRSGAQADQPTFGGVLAVAGNGVAGTGVQRVTIASDSTGTLAGVTTVATVTNLAQMNGAAITMGNGASGTGVQRVTLASDSTGVVAIASPATLGVYVEDAAETAGGNLMMIGTVRRDTAASSAGTTGDNATLNTDNLGQLWVNCGAGCSGGTQYTQDAALTVGTSVGGMAMGRASAAAPTDVSADNDAVMPWYLRSGAEVVQPTFAGVLATTGNGASGTGVQRVTIANDSTGILAGVTTVTTVTTVSTVSSVTAVGTITPGTAATSLGKAVDSAAGATDTGVAALAIRDDALTTLTPVDGDYVPLRTNSTGALWVQSSIIDAAEDAAVATNPVPAGCVYRTASVTLDNGDVGYINCDVDNNLKIVGVGTAGSAAGGVLTVQGVASMTPFLVNPGTAANWGVYIEDGAETAGGNLMMAGSVRRDTPTTSSGTTGDNSTINTNADGALWVTSLPNTTGGWSSFNATAADGATACTNSAQAVKASQGTLGGYFINNPNTTDEWVHFYNVAAASVTVGTTNPLFSIRIPGAAANSVGANVEFSRGVQFSTAIAVACTQTAATTTAPTNALEIDVLYK